ncbi:MAG: GTP 3',8-cyclase MoaA [Clostridia bacterium]
MNDSFFREVNYLRLSLTDDCTLHCPYCRRIGYDTELSRINSSKLLSVSEISRLVRAMSELGINKIRLTGGEPMLRPDLIDIIKVIKAVPGIDEITMTTNAQAFCGKANELKAAGLNRVNISLDSLLKERFKRLTGGDLDLVLSGIDEALTTGLTPVKINVVLMRGVNDDEFFNFLELAKTRPVDVRFIELMPISFLDTDSLRIPTDELIKKCPELFKLEGRSGNQPANEYTAPGFIGRVGFISPMSHRFCNTCNRIRVTGDGKIRMCLGNNDEIAIPRPIEDGNIDEVKRVIKLAIQKKPETHSFLNDFNTNRSMNEIGG